LSSKKTVVGRWSSAVGKNLELDATGFADDRGLTTDGEILGSGNGRGILNQPGL
jgi:hypothetical protein